MNKELCTNVCALIEHEINQGNIIFARILMGQYKYALTNLDCVVNDPQIRSNAAAQEKIKCCRFYPERKVHQCPSLLLEMITSTKSTTTFCYLYITIGWFI